MDTKKMLPVILAALPMVTTLFISPSVASAAAYDTPVIQAPQTRKVISVVSPVIPAVPFYSQFKDIQSPKWQKIGCGIASLAMIINYYKPDTISADALLRKGIAAGAYDKSAGWIYDGLIQLSERYGLDGDYYDLSELNSSTALEQFKKYSNDGPVIASIHYKFDPKNPIPHLVVINGINNNVVYYNDPASNGGGKQISAGTFLRAWKKRFIVVRPTNENIAVR